MVTYFGFHPSMNFNISICWRKKVKIGVISSSGETDSPIGKLFETLSNNLVFQDIERFVWDVQRLKDFDQLSAESAFRVFRVSLHEDHDRSLPDQFFQSFIYVLKQISTIYRTIYSKYNKTNESTLNVL